MFAEGKLLEGQTIQLEDGTTAVVQMPVPKCRSKLEAATAVLVLVCHLQNPALRNGNFALRKCKFRTKKSKFGAQKLKFCSQKMQIWHSKLF